MDTIIPPSDTPLKRCPSCPEENQWHPATTEFFGKDKNQADGLGRWCKECKRAYQRAYNKRPESREYHHAWRQRPEVQERQKAARKARRQRPEVREQERSYRKAYESRPDIREKRKEYYKPWRESYITSPEYRAYQEAYARDPEAYERKKAYRQSDHYKDLHKVNEHRRRALQRGNGGDHTVADIRAQYERQRGKCYYCRKPLISQHVDHVIPLVLGGSNGPENLVIACPACNHRKSDNLWTLF